MSNGALEKARFHLRLAETYWRNAMECWRDREYEKVTELIWGFVTQEVKAFAALRGLHLGTHRQLANFCRDLSRALGDDYFRSEFHLLNTLHVNFYEGILNEAEIPEYALRAWVFAGRLRALAELVARP